MELDVGTNFATEKYESTIKCKHILEIRIFKEKDLLCKQLYYGEPI